MGSYIDVRNGYTFSDAERLTRLNAALGRCERDTLMGKLRIGLQRHVEVTFASRFVTPAAPSHVSQAFCSALSCGYTGGSPELWAKVWLTLLGGGAFGNDIVWIADAIGHATERMRNHDLDVRIAHHRRLDDAVVERCASSS